MRLTHIGRGPGELRAPHEALLNTFTALHFPKILWDWVASLPIVAHTWKKEKKEISVLIPALHLCFKEPENGNEPLE